MRDEDIRGKVIRLLTGGEPAAGNVTMLPTARQRSADAGAAMTIKSQTIQRAERGANAMTPAQAREIQHAVERLVEIGVAAGELGGERAQLFARWYLAIKDRYEVPSYSDVPAFQVDEMLVWLKMEAQIQRPVVGRAQNAHWRNEQYREIWARAQELKVARADVYDIVADRLQRHVGSLEQLTDQDLRRLCEIMTMKGRAR